MGTLKRWLIGRPLKIEGARGAKADQGEGAGDPVVGHTVPAHALELADEVRLIDVTPETLLERISDGRLQRHNPALFQRGNLQEQMKEGKFVR